MVQGERVVQGGRGVVQGGRGVVQGGEGVRGGREGTKEGEGIQGGDTKGGSGAVEERGGRARSSLDLYRRRQHVVSSRGTKLPCGSTVWQC